MMPAKVDNRSYAMSDLAASRKALIDALIDVAGLTPSSHVLDVGCGFGRLAVGLADYLNADGSYDGFDIVPEAVNWCAANIRGQYGNIRFQHADIYSKEYNQHGRIKAHKYRFPFEDETFDIVALVSIFAHLSPAESDNYVGEISRVLKPKGRCFATYPSAKRKSRRQMSCRDSIIRFQEAEQDLGIHRSDIKKMPELAVGYDEGFVRGCYTKHGMSAKLYPGYWCKKATCCPRRSGIGDHNVMVACKP
jgi:SAM-dependent methyltransferase